MMYMCTYLQLGAFRLSCSCGCSLGVVLFELLTARLPFMAKTPIGIALKHRTEPPPAPRTLHPDIPAWLERVVLRCLEKDPVLRFGSAGELAGERDRGGELVAGGGGGVVGECSARLRPERGGAREHARPVSCRNVRRRLCGPVG